MGALSLYLVGYIGALFCIFGFYFAFFRIHHYLIVIFNLFKISSIKFYKLNPIIWDKMARLPYLDLDKILVSYYNESPEETLKEIERLIIEEYPSQKMGAIKAKTIIIARNSSKINALNELDKEINKLPEGDKGFLSQTNKIKDFVKDIVNNQNLLIEHDRPIYKYKYATNVEGKINNFYNIVGSYHKPLSSEFQQQPKMD